MGGARSTSSRQQASFLGVAGVPILGVTMIAYILCVDEAQKFRQGMREGGDLSAHLCFFFFFATTVVSVCSSSVEWCPESKAFCDVVAGMPLGAGLCFVVRAQQTKTTDT